MAPVLRKLHDVRVYAAAASLVLSAWAIYIDDVINNDGILYVRVAQLISQGEWNTAVSLHKWPFYSCLIALTGTVTGLDLEPAAHLLDALLLVLIVTSFITLVQILGGDRKTLVAAAAVILLYPGLNEYRSFVIRDFGYLGFYLLSLVFYFKTLNTDRWRLHAAWFASAIIAALFRIEGFALVLAMLILIRAKHWTGRNLVFKVSLVVVPAFAAMFIAFSWWIVGTQTQAGIGEILRLTVTKLFQTAHSRLEILSELVLPKYSADHALIVLVVSGITILTVEILSRLTIVNAFLAAHAWYRNVLFPLSGAKRVWSALVIANLSILAAIVAGVFFLTGRFPLAFSLTVMLAVPFSLCVLYEDWRAKPRTVAARNWKFPVAAALIVLTGLSGMTRFTDKTYLKEGALWIKQNAHSNTKLMTNEIVVTHYAGRPVFEEIQPSNSEQTEAFLRSGAWHNYDYLALNVKHRDRHRADAWIAQMNLTPVKVFKNMRNDQLLIFSTSPGFDEKESRSR